MIFRLLLFYCCLLPAIPAFSQRYIGQSEILNYEKREYNAGAQNWAVRQDVEGRMYFANNEGLLTFDGTCWKLFPLPNKTIMRAMEFGHDRKVYVGGQDEFGYFSPDPVGRLVFTSLVGLLPEAERKFADIWNIVSVGNDIFFRSSGKIFRYHEKKMTWFPSSAAWMYLGLVNGRLLALDDATGLSEFLVDRFTPIIPASELPQGFHINDMISAGADSVLVCTNGFGLYTLAGNRLVPFRLSGIPITSKQEFTSIIQVDAGHFIVGSLSNGFYLMSRGGVVLDNFSKRDGLQNSSIRTMFVDKGHNVWLGLDSGIDFIAFNNAIKEINPPIMNGGSGFAVSILNGNLYFGLSTGVFRMPLPGIPDLSFSPNALSPVMTGQTYGFSVLNNELLVARDDGFFQVKDGAPIPVAKNTGFWTFESLQQFRQGNTIAAGTYLGVRLFDFNNGHYTDRGSVPDIKASSRFLVIDNDQTIWVSHPYRGIYRIITRNAGADYPVKLYTKSNGLPSTLNNHVYKVKNKVVIATENGIYEYNQQADSFQVADYYKDIFGDRGVRYLREDRSGNIWFVQEKNIGVVDFSTREPRLIFFPELTGKIMSGFEHIYPVDDNNIFVGGEKGFYHINYEKYKQNDVALNVYIRTVKAIGRGERLLYDGYATDVNSSSIQQASAVRSVNHNLNSFHFEFSAPLFEQQSNVEYSYVLENFDRDWSDWSRKTEKDYTNLPAGTYTFKVRMRNNLRGESAISSYTITVLPPWYATLWAWLVYILLVAGLIVWLLKKHQEKLLSERIKHQEEQRQQAYLHQLELEKSEKEVVKLRNEKLEAEIGFKNSQLASTAMHLVQKEEFLQKIREELQHMNKSVKEQPDAAELKKILRIMSEEEKVTEEWEQFSVHFDKVNGDFLRTLKGRYPDLKAHELKLCAYLRMNLSSKEIAQLMSISVRGVEISRYRLRKKLHIPRETNLFQFLFEIHRKDETSPGDPSTALTTDDTGIAGASLN